MTEGAAEGANGRRPSRRTVAALAFGLLLGIVGGWVAGMLRAPRPAAQQEPSQGSTRMAAG